MRFNRSEYSRFVQRLDRTAEKNPVLWLPCIILLAVIVGFGELRETVKIAFSRPERHTSGGKSSAAECKAYQKPFLFRAAAMSLACAFGFMFMSDLGLIAYADEFNDDPSYTDWQNDISVTGNDPFGNMLADEFNSKSNEQEANAGYNVFSVEMQGNTAVVDFETLCDSTIVVGIYDDFGVQLITTGSAQVTADENQATVELDSSKIPQYFYIKAYLINTETMRPLCTVYECPTYTQEMQDFLSKTVLDFDTDRVLNLDTDISNNFAVFSEDAVISQETVSHNNVVSVDNDRNVYVIENADDIVKNLQSGDVYSQEYGNNEVLVVKVASVDVIDNTVTIYGDDSALEDVFEYVKIDSTFSSSDVVADMSTLEEGVEYNYTGGIATYAVDVGGGVSYDHKFKFTDKDIENYKDETTSAKVNLNGSLDLHLGGRAKLYISWSQTYVELVLDYSAKLQLTFSESLHGKIPLIHFEVSPCAGVYIKFDPSIVVELDGKISLAGELSGSYGFKADKNGAHNISQSPRFTHELSAVGTFYIGVSLEPKVSIISEKLVNAYINGRMGVEVKASLKYGSTDENNGIQHDCKSCIDGDISIKFNLSAGIKLLNDKLSFNIDLINKQVKIADFYRSDDFGDSGFTKCPHYSYKVSAHIYGEHGAPPKETKIECSNGNVYTTDINGRVDFYLPNGEYWFKISNDKYSSSDYAKIHNKPTTISAWLDSTFAHSSSGGGGSVEPIDPTPIDPNPVDPDPTPTESDFIYTISNGEVTITGYKGTDTEVVIPDTIEGLLVTRIGGRAFYNCTSLISIDIPYNVTSIDSGAFMNCTNLTNITLPDTLNVITEKTFSGCSSLSNIVFPKGLKEIEAYAFSECTNLSNVIIPFYIEKIGRYSFEKCENATIYYPFSALQDDIGKTSLSIGYELSSNTAKICRISTHSDTLVIPKEIFADVDIKYPVDCICSNVIYNSRNVSNISIEEGIEVLDEHAFYNISNVSEIYIPDSVVEIGEGAFSRCSNLVKVHLSNSINAIKNDTFGDCSSLCNVIIPENVVVIGDSAFYRCTSLEDVTIPYGVTSIGSYAFYECFALSIIIVPPSVNEIKDYAFAGAQNATIYYPTYAIEHYYDYFHGSLRNTNDNLGYSLSNNVITIDEVRIEKGNKQFVIPNEICGYPVTKIGDYAFKEGSDVTKIVIPSNVLEIGFGAFFPNYEDWTLPLTKFEVSPQNKSYKCIDGVLFTIDGGELVAFPSSKDIQTYSIPNGTKVIRGHAFAGCNKLQYVTFPYGLEFVEKYAFSAENSYSYNLKIKGNLLLPETVKSIGDKAFHDVSSTMLYYPSSAECSEPGISYTIDGDEVSLSLQNRPKGDLVVPQNINGYKVTAFENSSGFSEITSVKLPDSLKVIGEKAFYDCDELESIEIPNGVTEIGKSAFESCDKLAYVKLPNNLMKINDEAFSNCRGIVSISIPNTLRSIGKGAFKNCEGLVTICIPSNVQFIEERAFQFCTKLNEVNIANGTKSIDIYAFRYCYNLERIIIPNSVENIDWNAFQYCDKLTIYCVAGSEAENFAIKKGIPYVIIDDPTENTVQFEDDEIETTPVIDTETDNDVTDNFDSNTYPIENPEDTANDETDLQEVIAAVTETPEVYNSYDKPIYLKSAMDISVSQTFTGLIPNEVYNCYGMKSRKAEDPFNGSNLLFIVQTVSDSNGNLTFSYLPDEGYSNPQIFVKAMTEFDVYNATIIYAEENDGSVSIGWNPVDGASQYKVYKVVNNVYVEYQTVTATNCTVTGLSADTKCGFIVQTCIHGEWSVLFGKDVLYYNASAGEHKHEFGTVWKSDENSHWHECSCGEKADNAPHSFDSGVITLEPTETTEGIMTYTCTVCGYSYTTAIFPEDPDHTEHTFDTIWHSDATSHWHECTVCGIHSDTANHTENRGVVTTLPTATTPGIRTYSCSVCGYVMRTETILATGGGSTVNPDPPSPSYPDVTPPSVTYPNGTGTPAAKEPYIYGDTSKSGWDAVISEIDFAPDGSTVKVNMNGMTELPKAVVSHIQNRSIILELSVSGAVWTIDGLDVTEPKTVDLRVSNTNKIPASVIESLNSNPKAKQLRLYHNGDLGFRATLTLNIGNRYNGYYAVLYYYNTSEIKPEFIGESLAQNGKVQFEISHASYYILTFSNKSVFEDVGAGAGEYADSEPIEAPVSKSNAPVREFLPIDRKCFSTKRRRYRIIKR